MTASGTTSAPTTAAPHLDADGLSHTGLVRPTNEDHFVVLELQKTVALRRTNLQDVRFAERLKRPEAHVLAVADGVGGLASGEVASGITVQVITE